MDVRLNLSQMNMGNLHIKLTLKHQHIVTWSESDLVLYITPIKITDVKMVIKLTIGSVFNF